MVSWQLLRFTKHPTTELSSLVSCADCLIRIDHLFTKIKKLCKIPTYLLSSSTSRIWRISLDPNLRKWDICVAETSRHEDADDEAQRMSRRRPSISTQPRLCSSAAVVISSRAASSSSFSAASFSACCLKRKTHEDIHNVWEGAISCPHSHLALSAPSRHWSRSSVTNFKFSVSNCSSDSWIVIYVNDEVKGLNM